MKAKSPILCLPSFPFVSYGGLALSWIHQYIAAEQQKEAKVLRSPTAEEAMAGVFA